MHLEMNMTIVDDEPTVGVTVMSSTLDNDLILIGHSEGRIDLWSISELAVFKSFKDDDLAIVYLYPLSAFECLAINELGFSVIWDVYYGSVLKRFFISLWKPDFFTMLPGELLVFSKYRPRQSQTLEVWDVRTGICLHAGFHSCSYANGILLDVTPAGYLVVASTFGRNIFVYNVSRTYTMFVCKRKSDPVFALAATPTNQIILGSRNILVYKLSYYGNLYKCRVIEHTNIIDTIVPASGYKFLTVDRSCGHSGVLKLWDLPTGTYEYLGNSRYIGTPRYVSHWYNSVFSFIEERMFIKHYDRSRFHFSKKLAEIRKHVRILAQAQRTGTSFFIILPIEIQVKIVLMTVSDMNQSEQQVCNEIAWSNFCRPHFSEVFFKEKFIDTRTFKKKGNFSKKK